MDSKILSFIAVLRSRDVRISPAESLDAMDIVSVLGFSNRDYLHDGLAMALAKTPEEKATFSQCFNHFFSQQLLDFSSEEAVADDEAAKPGADSEAAFPGESQSPAPANPDAALQDAATQNAQLQELLARPLMQNLMQNNRNELSLALNRAGEQVGQVVSSHIVALFRES